jgi:hypothetical protein
MVFEPGIQVNPVIDAAPSQANMRHFELGQERGSNPQVQRGLFLGKTPHRRQRQALFFHRYQPRLALRYASAPSSCASLRKSSTRPGALTAVLNLRALSATRCASRSSKVWPLRAAITP